MAVAVRDLLTAIERAYPRRLAEPWDTGIGLTCGDPDDEVRQVLLSVDITDDIITEAIEHRASVIITHHPLLFRPVQSLAANTEKGRLIHRLMRSGIAHIAVHTNADRAVGGVNDALADTFGLQNTAPLLAADAGGLDKFVVFIPQLDADRLIGEMAAAGAGSIGKYAEAAFVTTGEGRFRPLAGAQPAVGTVGSPERVVEARVEMICPRRSRDDVIAAIRRTHPYEEPAFDIFELAPSGPVGGAGEGLGRFGTLPAAMTLREFTVLVAERLPATAWGVRAAGDPDREIRTVAVCGGSGGSLLSAATESGADVLVTSDITHHTAQEHVEDAERPAIVDVAHWAGEWPFLGRMKLMLHERFRDRVRSTVSTLRTDAWSLASPSIDPAAASRPAIHRRH